MVTYHMNVHVQYLYVQYMCVNVMMSCEKNHALIHHTFICLNHSMPCLYDDRKTFPTRGREMIVSAFFVFSTFLSSRKPRENDTCMIGILWHGGWLQEGGTYVYFCFRGRGGLWTSGAGNGWGMELKKPSKRNSFGPRKILKI